jgi:hypothetical protein
VRDHFGQEDAIAYEDLGWLAVDAEGEAEELQADAEFRMQRIADIAGLIRDPGGADNFGAGVLAEAEIEMAPIVYTEEELHALEKAQASGFTEKTGTHNNQ